MSLICIKGPQGSRKRACRTSYKDRNFQGALSSSHHTLYSRTGHLPENLEQNTDSFFMCISWHGFKLKTAATTTAAARSHTYTHVLVTSSVGVRCAYAENGYVLYKPTISHRAHQHTFSTTAVISIFMFYFLFFPAGGSPRRITTGSIYMSYSAVSTAAAAVV